MKRYQLFIFSILFFLTGNILLAQEEVYDKPTQIIDTLDNTYNSDDKKENTKTKQQKADALSDLEKKKEKLNRVRVGGNFGFQFGNYTYVNVSPTVGYMVVNKRLELGGGPVFIYERFRYTNNFAINLFTYGSDLYARGFLYKGFYLEARYDALNKTSYFDLNRRLWVHHLLLGAGYAASIGKIGVFNISLLYNVLDNDESVYQGTFSSRLPLILNIGFGFGVGGR